MRYIPHILAVIGIFFAIIFASLWSSEVQHPARQAFNDVQVDVMGIVSGATCEFNERSADLLLSFKL